MSTVVQWAFVLIAAITSGGAWAQANILLKAKPEKVWADAGGYYTGYRSSGELQAAQNSASEQAFSNCLARFANSPTWECSKIVRTGIRPALPTFPQKYNGDYWYFMVDAYMYVAGAGASGYPYTRDLSNSYGVYSSLVCPDKHGFGASSTLIGPDNYEVVCLKYLASPRYCPPCSDAAGGAGGPGGGPGPGGAGNPIQIANGTKTEAHVDFVDPRGTLTVQRAFLGQLDGWRMPGDSRNLVDTSMPLEAGGLTEQFTGVETDANGLTTQRTVDISFSMLPSTPYGEVYVNNPDGSLTTYVANASGAFAPDPSGDTLEPINPASPEGATLRIRRANNVIEEFGADGRPRRRQFSDGRFVVYTYTANALTQMTDNWGRKLVVTPGAGGQAGQILLPRGQTISYAFTNKFLNSVIYEDLSSRQYLYNEPTYAPSTAYAPYQITGSIDENGARIGTYYYDFSGTAISTEGAGGVNKYSMYFGGSYSQVTTPLGASWYIYFTSVRGTTVVSRRIQPAGSGSDSSSAFLSYDANANVTSADDYKGNRTCYGYDLARAIETSRIEGLTSDLSCATYLPDGTAIPAGSRRVTTSWHPHWRLAAKRAEPGRLTTWVYNSQPDPFNGNAPASCAPPTALLPDGKKIAVLCKQVEQATTDADGHLGLAAALQSGVANRVQQWTYNQYGQVLTAKDPLNNTTTFAYYTDTSFTGADPNAQGHTVGDLQTITNAKLQVTTFTKYNKHGQVLETSDPNGVLTVNTYDPRQRLLSTSVGGQTTSYAYDPAGQLLKITAPDASWVGFEYDPAHRMTATKDNLGNRIEYSLDNAGNRTAENVKDPGGTLRRQLARTFDALGRVQQTNGRE